MADKAAFADSVVCVIIKCVSEIYPCTSQTLKKKSLNISIMHEYILHYHYAIMEKHIANTVLYCDNLVVFM